MSSFETFLFYTFAIVLSCAFFFLANDFGLMSGANGIWIVPAIAVLSFGAAFIVVAFLASLNAADDERFIRNLPTQITDYIAKRMAVEEYPSTFKDAYLDGVSSFLYGTYNYAHIKELATLAQEDLGTYAREKYGPDFISKVGDLFVKAYNRLGAVLPPYLAEDGPFRVPFSSVLNGSAAIDDFFHTFQRSDKLAWEIFAQYTQNWYAAEAAAKAKLYPKNSRLYIERVIEHTPLSSILDVMMPISLPDRLRFEGMWIVAPPGRGKTTLLSVLLKEDLGTEASVIVMDSKGDLIDHLKRADVPEDDIVIIEPWSNLAINPLDLGAHTGETVSLLEYLFTSLLDTAPTPLQSTLFRSVLLAMQAIPDATFDTFRQFLQQGWQPFEEHVRKMHPDDRDFFLNGEYDSKTYKDTKEQLLWRIRDLTTKVPLMRDMFKAPKTQVNLSELMDSGKLILIDNSAAKLSGGVEFFSRFFIALILQAAQQRAGRPDSQKRPCYVYVDECDTVISKDPNIAQILHRCRSQKIGLVLAHQEIQQIKSEDVRGALANCAIRLANSDDDASQLAPRLRTDADTLRNLKRGQFALFMRDYTKAPIIINVPNEPVSQWPKTEFLAQRMERMRSQFCFTPKPEERETPDDGEMPDKGEW